MSEIIERKSKWGKVGKVALFFLVVLICAYAGLAHYFGITRAANAYEQNRDAAKKAGLWFEAADARSFYEVSDQDNGALLLGDFKKVFKALKLTQKDITDGEFIKSFAQLEPYIPTLKQAAAKRKILFRKPIKNPYYGIGDVTDLYSVVRVLAKRAEFAIKRDEQVLGRDLFVVAAQLSIHVADEPSNIRTRIYCADAIEQAIRPLIPVYGHDPYWRSVFVETMKMLDHPYDVRSYMRKEHWMTIWFVEILYGDTSKGTLGDLGLKDEDSLPSKYLFGKFTPRVATAIKSRMHEIYASIWRDLPADPDDTEGLIKALTPFRVMSTYPDLSYDEADKVDEDFISLGRVLNVEVAQRNVLLQALALLDPEADPESGLPLPGRYRADVRGGQIYLEHQAKGWVISSVGRNGKDDHAVPPPASIDDFVVHLSPATIDPKDSTRQKPWGLGFGGIQ